MGCDGFLTSLDRTPTVTSPTCYECSKSITGVPEDQHAGCIKEWRLHDGQPPVRALRFDLPEVDAEYVER